MSRPVQSSFFFPHLIQDLMPLVMPNDLDAESLDYRGMVRIPDDWVPDGPRYADHGWSIPVQGRLDESGFQPTHVVVILKFVTEVVMDIGERLGRHSASLEREIFRRGAFGAPSNPPPIAPIVVYDGPDPWDAPGGIPFKPT